MRVETVFSAFLPIGEKMHGKVGPVLQSLGLELTTLVQQGGQHECFLLLKNQVILCDCVCAICSKQLFCDLAGPTVS